MVSVPSTHLILFIASMAVAASVAGAFTAESSRLSATIEDVGVDVSAEIATDVVVVTDPGGPVYDGDSDALTVQVSNVGERTVPHSVDQVDVFLDGAFQPAANLSTSLPVGSAWTPDSVLTIVVDAPDLAWGDHRVKIVVDGDEETFEFRNCAGISRDGVAFETNANKDLAVINRSGAITVLGAKTAGFSPVMADFDCDGQFEVSYIADTAGTINVIDLDGENQQLTTTSIGVTGRRLGVGDLDGDGRPAVIYQNGSDNDFLYRVEVGEPPERIGAGFAARSVGGVADFNGDGDLDVVYLGTNDHVRYLDDGTSTSTGANARDSYAIGSPMDFDGDGEVRVPIREQTTQAIYLVDSAGNLDPILSVYSSSVGSLGSFDWDDDGTPDIMTSNQNDGRNIYYLQLDGTNTAITDDGGNNVPTSTDGVA